MKKWTRWGIGLLCAAVVMFGARSIAGVSHADEASTTVSGTVKTVDTANNQVILTTDGSDDKTVTIANNVWVLLDSHKALLSDIAEGFKVELILNGKKQAAYIKAVSITITSSPAGATPSPASSSPTPSPTATAIPAPTATPTPSPTATPSSSQTPAQTAAHAGSATSAAELGNLHIIVEAPNLKLDLHDKEHGMSMIKMKPKGHDGFFLKGEAAEKWIAALLAGIDLQAPNAQQQISSTLSGLFDLSVIGLNVQINVEANPVNGGATPSPSPSSTPTPTPAPAATPAATPTEPAASPSTEPANSATVSIVPQLQITVQHDEDDDEDEDEDKGKDEDKDHGDKKEGAKQQWKSKFPNGHDASGKDRSDKFGR